VVDPGGPDRTARTWLDTSVPHSARIWNYWLGGKDNYQVDRDAGDAWVAVNPQITVIARETRAFLRRSVRFLATEAGIRQFLDVGTGLPTADNTHEVAQRFAPGARIVYVDNDPLVLTHARALLASSPQGATHYLDVDMHDSAKLITGAAELLDFDRPIAVLFMAVLGHLADTGEAHGLVRGLLDRMSSGSYLVICDSSHPPTDTASQRAKREYADTGAAPYHNRSPAELESLFDGLDWVEPGFVSAPLWRPEQPTGVPRITDRPPTPINLYGGVARKP
jgi:hypothetical protein